MIFCFFHVSTLRGLYHSSIHFSTTAVNKYTDETKETETSYGTAYQSGVTLKATDEWQTFVFDASVLLSNVFKKTGDNYMIDTWYIANANLASTEYIDIEYIAFAENDAEISALVGEGNSYTLIKSANGASTENVTVPSAE